MEQPKDNRFSVFQTNIIKGFACLMLIIHHLFFNSPENYDNFTSLIKTSSGVPLVCVISYICKICVPMFLLLSGYGINASLNKRIASSTNKKRITVILRSSAYFLWKLWSGFIFIYILFVPWQPLFGRMPYTNVFDILFDVTGLAYITKTPMMNNTWWYVGATLLAYVLTPVIKLFVSRFKMLTLVAVCTMFFFRLYYNAPLFLLWLGVYILGMLINETNVISRLEKAKELKNIYLITVSLLAVSLCSAYIFLNYYSALIVGGPVFVSFVFLCVSKIPVLNKFLELVGKHSRNIFLFHTFIYAYNFSSVVYSLKYPVFIFIGFTAFCVVLSIFIEKLKDLTRFSRLTDFISKKISV